MWIGKATWHPCQMAFWGTKHMLYEINKMSAFQKMIEGIQVFSYRENDYTV